MKKIVFILMSVLLASCGAGTNAVRSWFFEAENSGTDTIAKCHCTRYYGDSTISVLKGIIKEDYLKQFRNSRIIGDDFYELDDSLRIAVICCWNDGSKKDVLLYDSKNKRRERLTTFQFSANADLYKYKGDIYIFTYSNDSYVFDPDEVYKASLIIIRKDNPRKVFYQEWTNKAFRGVKISRKNVMQLLLCDVSYSSGESLGLSAMHAIAPEGRKGEYNAESHFVYSGLDEYYVFDPKANKFVPED